MDFAVNNATIVTLTGDGLGILDDGTLAVDADVIEYVGKTSEFDDDPERVIDAEGCVVLPGLVDAHRHSGHALLRGGAQDLPEIEWMTDGLGPIARHATTEDHIVGTRLAVAESLLSGVTTFGEYASGVGRLVDEVYEPLGLRVVAIETIDEVVDDREERGPDEPYAFDRSKGEAALNRAEELFDEYGGHPLVTPAYGPQAVDMVSPELLRTVGERAREQDRDFHVHVAQGNRERRQIQARYGDEESTVSVLDQENLLGEHLVAIHCHDATPGERKRLADSGARFLGCPSSIGAIDGVVPPLTDFLERGTPVGVGTDQAPGPGGHDFFRELRTASLLSKTDATDPTAMPAWEAIQRGTVGGARALGLDDAVGTLAEGTAADFVVIDMDAPTLAPAVSEPLHTAIPNLVFSGGSRGVRDVFVAGERVVAEGEIQGLDLDAVVAEAQERAERIFDDAAADWRAADSTLVSRADDGWL